MKTHLVYLLLFLFQFALFSNEPKSPDFLNAQKQSSGFMENKGQICDFQNNPQPQVKYLYEQGNLQIFLLSTGIAYQFKKVHPSANSKSMPQKKRSELAKEDCTVETYRTDMQLLEANQNAKITTEGKSADYINYYSRQVMDIRSYTKITYHEIYPGIDWVIYCSNNKIKYDFVVKVGADPEQIKIRFDNFEKIALNSDGSLTIENLLGKIEESRPISSQGFSQVPTQFKLEGKVVTFDLVNYDRRKELIIDPFLSWATYYGGTPMNQGLACSADAAGNIFLAGRTESDGMISSSGHQMYPGGYDDAFLVKFDNSGQRLWATFYGGMGNDIGLCCTTDQSGNVFLGGTTECTAGISAGGHQNSFSGVQDAFLAKFASNGTRLWGTYYGGGSIDIGYDCQADASGNIFLAGETQSSNQIAAGGFQNTKSGGTDGFLVKFNSNGTRQWGTYYGGSLEDVGHSCGVDKNGNVYLAGNTESINGIASNGFQNNYGGGVSDGFAVKFDATGTRIWGTYYGDNYNDEINSCRTDTAGNLFLVGHTESQNLSYLGHQNQLLGANGLAIKLDKNGSRIWATYYGGSGFTWFNGSSVDEAGNLYACGTTESTTDISYAGIQNSFKGGFTDAVLVKFSSGGIREWGTYYGGSSRDKGYGCYAWSGTYAVLCGITESTSNISSGGFQNTLGGFQDAFLVRLDPCSPPSQPSAIVGPTAVCAASYPTYSVLSQKDALSYVWSFTGNWAGSSTTNSVAAGPSSYSTNVSVIATGTCGNSNPSNLAVLSVPEKTIKIVSSESVHCSGTTATLTAEGAFSSASYTWSSGSSTYSEVINVNTLTVYTITSDYFGCNTTHTFAVDPDNSAAFNYTVNGMVANFQLLSSKCNSFTWDFGNGNGSTINSNPITTYATAGTYAVCLKCSGLPNACTKCVTINVPSNTMGGVGIEELRTSRTFEIYPNPASDNLVIEATAKTEIVLYNLTSEIVFQTQLEIGTNNIDTRFLTNGIYFIKFIGNEASRKVVINR